MSGTSYGSYELLRKIAAGGMAEIFLARYWGHGGFFRDVVIKRLFRNLSEDERTLRMFQYEARLLAELCHPNIPQVYDLGFADDSWYIAMEYVDGHSVADVWRAGARAQRIMPLPVAVGIVVQGCEALAHAHDRRDRAGRALEIVHRDVTPHNLMLTYDGLVKVMDFGVAQTAARRDTEAGAIKGTFSYMAPEQVRGTRVDRRADVFSLGVLLYELTTGTRLFRGTDIQVMTAIVERDVPPPSSVQGDYPSNLEAIVLRALARDRDARLGSVLELDALLADFTLDRGLDTGARAVAEYVRAVYPAEPAADDTLALVAPPRLEVVFEEETDPTLGNREAGPPSDSPGMEFSDESINRDLDRLTPSADADTAETGPPVVSSAQDALPQSVAVVAAGPVVPMAAPSDDEHTERKPRGRS